MEAASSSGFAVFQPTPSQEMARRLTVTGSGHGSKVRTAVFLMGINEDSQLPGRALVHVDEALLLAYIAVAVARDTSLSDDIKQILDLDQDHQAPYTLRAWAPDADRPAAHLEVEATRAAGLHEARIWMRRQPAAHPLAAGERGVTAHTHTLRVLASCPLASREHAVRQLQEALAYCESFSHQVCHSCNLYQLVWPACRGEYCLGCLLSWFCEHP